MELIRFLSIYAQEARKRGSTEAGLLEAIIQGFREGHVEELLPQLRVLAGLDSTPAEVAALFLAVIDTVEQDYERLGAMIGSAWRDTYPKAGPKQRNEAEVTLINVLGLHQGSRAYEPFLRSLSRTMQGKCYGCGTGHEVGRDGHGVYCCEICVGQ